MLYGCLGCLHYLMSTFCRFSATNDINATADMSAVGEASGDRNVADTRDTSDMHPATKRSRIDVCTLDSPLSV